MDHGARQRTKYIDVAEVHVVDRPHVGSLTCSVFTRFKDKLQGMRNYNPAFIEGSKNLRTSTIHVFPRLNAAAPIYFCLQGPAATTQGRRQYYQHNTKLFGSSSIGAVLGTNNCSELESSMIGSSLICKCT